MGWLDFFKVKKGDEKKSDDIEDDDDDKPVRLCQGCGKKEDDENVLKVLKHMTTDGLYKFLFCRKCYRMMKKGKLPPLIAQMQSQQKGR